MKGIHMSEEKFAELVTDIFVSGVAYGMAHQVKADAEEYHITDETGKILYSNFSASDLAISFYPEAFIPSALKNNNK
ncbi:MAG: hypothetical protein ACI37Z_05195 [Candidatus Gastranaerophilaceae bacterium]